MHVYACVCASDSVCVCGWVFKCVQEAVRVVIVWLFLSLWDTRPPAGTSRCCWSLSHTHTHTLVWVEYLGGCNMIQFVWIRREPETSADFNDPEGRANPALISRLCCLSWDANTPRRNREERGEARPWSRGCWRRHRNLTRSSPSHKEEEEDERKALIQLR